MKELLIRYKSMILYIVFGVLTTAVNVAVYWLATRLLNCSVTVSTVLAWILSVLFAYAANRTWVFESHASEMKEVMKEIISFFLARLSTGLLDMLIMYVFAETLAMPDMPVKIASNVIVIILNYVLSRFLVFRKG